MPKELRLAGVFVQQGNSNGKSIETGSESVLFTSDLVDCIAILIVDNKNCYMIHSDANLNTGIKGVPLQQGLKELGLSKDNHYKIGLIGGQSEKALLHKKEVVKKLLPNAEVSFMKSGVDSAYLLGNGLMADTKRAIKEALKLDNIIIDEMPRSIPRP